MKPLLTTDRQACVTGELILTLHAENFDVEIKRDGRPILVDFWAAWCKPCAQIVPCLERIAAELQGQARVAQIDVDRNGDLVNRFDIRSIPTLLVFHAGKVVEHLVGAAPEPRIRDLLVRHLAR